MLALAVGARGVPVKVGEAIFDFAAIEETKVAHKFASSPNAAANSFSVFNVPGAESTRFDTAVVTKQVVAI